MSGVDPRAVPWRDRDVVTVCGTSLAGLALIVTAWFGASATVSTARQAAWTNLGVAGFAVGAGGLCLWLLRARRALGERRVTLIALAPTDDDEDTRTGPAPRTTSTDDTLVLPLVRAEGMDRPHRPDCPLVAGKDVTPAAVGAGEPCRVCSP
ncbi:hypothetical protein ACOKM5_01670 [Streptomyces sp. BH097]|uniref:hypothetical protein n=1 Tax=unclassified Streptomyces TaxID=2593676 RepID=UPI003BB671B9